MKKSYPWPVRAAGWFAAILVLALLPELVYRWSLRAGAMLRGPEEGVFDLYAIGESSMKGIPFKESPPELAARMLGGRIGGRRIRVKNLALGGQGVYPQYLYLAGECEGRDRSAPGALLIYVGHNEQVGGQFRYWSAKALAFVKRRVLRGSLFYGKALLALDEKQSVTSIKDLEAYDFYLRRCVETARSAGLVPVIATLASNVSGAETDAGPAPAWKERVYLALELEKKGRFSEALGIYSSALKDNDSPKKGSSYLRYRAARCLKALGRTAEASEAFSAALESDPIPLRAKPSQNPAIRKAAAELGVPLFDAEKELAALSPGGLPGGDVFLDFMHPDAPGYEALALGFARAVSAAFSWPLPAEAARVRLRRDPDAYVLSGLVMLTFSGDNAPVPDRLSLAEKNFRRALAAGGRVSPYAALGLRMAEFSRASGEIVPPPLHAWLVSMHHKMFWLSPPSEAELAEAEKILTGSGGVGVFNKIKGEADKQRRR